MYLALLEEGLFAAVECPPELQMVMLDARQL
jgi:hypothetical protein